MPVISRKENTRNGVADQISGSNCGAVSMSPTVVVPVRSNMRAPFNHDSGRLMPKHHRIDAAGTADPVLCVRMHIGATDTHGLHANLDVAWTGIGLIAFGYLKATRAD